VSTNYEILRNLTHEVATQYVGQTFQLIRDGQPAAAFDLTAVERLMPNRPRSSRMKRDPFSLYFTGPAEPLLPQGMYDLKSESVSLDGLFLVPLGRNEQGRYEYEAVFT